jgi:hypothetical protein
MYQFVKVVITALPEIIYVWLSYFKWVLTKRTMYLSRLMH